MTVTAPGRGSTTTCCFQRSERCGPMMRALASLAAPTGYGMTRRTILLGNCWAFAQIVNARVMTAKTHFAFMLFSVVTRTRSWKRDALPGLDARRLRYLPETFNITCHKSTDLLRRVIHYDARPGCLEGTSFGASHDGPEPFVQPLDYEIGRFTAHENRAVGVIDELRKAAFLHGRHFGRKGMTFLGRH